MTPPPLLLVPLLLAATWRPWPHIPPTPPIPSSAPPKSTKAHRSSSTSATTWAPSSPVTSTITVHPIWYGRWPKSHKKIIREFITSIVRPPPATANHPSVSGWWKTVQLYTDQTGANISKTVLLGEEKNDRFYSNGKSFTRLSIQRVIALAVTAKTRSLPVNQTSGVYLVLTADDVYVQDFCGQVCGFHYFTFPSIYC